MPLANSKTAYGYDYDWGNPAFWQPYVYDGVERWDRRRSTASAEVRLASPPTGERAALAWLLGAYALRLEEDGRYSSIGRSNHFLIRRLRVRLTQLLQHLVNIETKIFRVIAQITACLHRRGHHRKIVIL